MPLEANSKLCMTLRFPKAFAAALLLVGCVHVEPQPDQRKTNAGIVVSADPRASEAGLEMLRQGGSATDAAIAVMLALTVIEPQSSGIGGGGFMLRGLPDGTVTSFDGRETAPAAATPAWFLDANGQPRSGRDVVTTGLSVGVPGNIALAAEAHRQFGVLPWATLFGPAERLAREGFAMNARLHHSLDGLIARAGLDPLMREDFYDTDGTPRDIGTLILRPELAETFRHLAADGPDAMYGAEAAEALAAHVAANTPGDHAITAADIMQYEAREQDALCGTYRAYRICTMGPPSSGISLIATLGQLESYDIAAMGPESLQFWHLLIESQKLAYADRELYFADPAFVSVPARTLIAPAYLAARSQLIDPERTRVSYPAGVPADITTAYADGDEPMDAGTSHFAVVDGNGAMVSFTSTVEGGFGSGLQFGGYHLNNELTDFSFSPEVDGRPVANRVEGGKRPRSSMTPTIVWDPAGEPFMVVGAAGGPFIPMQTARTIIGVIDFGLPIVEAMRQPILLAGNFGTYIEESTWLAGQTAALEAMGHENLRVGPQPFGSVGSVGMMRVDGQWAGTYDPRFYGRVGDP